MTIVSSQFNGTAPGASSTDIHVLEIQYEYCEQLSSDFTHCGVLDEINMNNPILKSRICDGFYDCPYGYDENGFLADCQVSSAGDCCETYLVLSSSLLDSIKTNQSTTRI